MTGRSPKGRLQQPVSLHRLGVSLSLVAVVMAACGSSPAAPPASPRQAIRTPAGSGGENDPSVIERPHVVLVSFDGFRPDYLARFDTPAFDRLAVEGAAAEGLIPIFPSLTFPSHYTIATGLYPEHHGIVGNRFYDPERDDEFNYRDTADTGDGSWWDGEPIWNTAETQGMVAAAFFFPGTEANIGAIRPTHWRPYDGSVRNDARVDQVIAWLEEPPATRPHLITAYFSMVDGAGHSIGPDAPAMRRSVESADRVLARLIDGLDQLSIAGRIYTVVVSDHGMTAVDPARDTMLPDLIDLDGLRAVATGPNMSLHLAGTTATPDEIAAALNVRLQHATAYTRAELPERLHARDNARLGDVVVVAEEGARVGFRSNRSPPAGMHGWDPTLPSMHGIFLARGPAIGPGTELPAFESVHIYPWLASVLGLTPHDPIDGDVSVLTRRLGPP